MTSVLSSSPTFSPPRGEQIQSLIDEFCFFGGPVLFSLIHGSWNRFPTSSFFHFVLLHLSVFRGLLPPSPRSWHGKVRWRLGLWRSSKVAHHFDYYSLLPILPRFRFLLNITLFVVCCLAWFACNAFSPIFVFELLWFPLPSFFSLYTSCIMGLGFSSSWLLAAVTLSPLTPFWFVFFPEHGQ